MSLANINDPRHKRIVSEVHGFFTGHGFNVSEKTYHDGHLPKKIVEKLTETFSPTALHIRASADHIAINSNNGMALFLECKSGTGQRGAIMVEALPLATHMYHARHGVMCLYCCLDKADIHRGFWAHNIPQLQTLWIPPQRSLELGYWYNRILPPMFPGIAFANAPTRGSNDPFVIIDESVVIGLPSWQELFEVEQTRWINNGNSAWEEQPEEEW
jgi:hypothetical protein